MALAFDPAPRRSQDQILLDAIAQCWRALHATKIAAAEKRSLEIEIAGLSEQYRSLTQPAVQQAS